MASRVCWNCEVLTQHIETDEPVITRDQSTWSVAFHCAECRAMSIGMLGGHISNYPRGVLQQITDDNPIITWLPERPRGKSFEDVPEWVSAAASEAHLCHSVSAFRAAILLARSVIEAVAKDQGIVRGKLIEKIDLLHERGIVRELIKDLAHEARHLGNDMAHGDFVQPVSGQESNDILGIMDEVLLEVYQSPAKLLRIREGRIAREAASKGQ